MTLQFVDLGGYGLGDDIVIGKGSEVPDFFRAIYLQADQEQRVLLVNNYLQLLWRAGRAAGLGSSDPVMQKVNATLGLWVTWKQQYDDAVLRRYIPFLRDWSAELDTWSTTVSSLQTDLDAATAGAVTQDLAQKGLTPDAIKPDASSQLLTNTIQQLNSLLSSSWFLPLLGIGASLLAAGYAFHLFKDVRSEFSTKPEHT